MVSFQCDVKLMKAFLCLGKQILCKFPKAYLLMDQDDGTDSYISSIKDPYLAQASTSSILSNLSAFSLVDDPQVQQIVKSYSVKNPFNKKPLDYLN